MDRSQEVLNRFKRSFSQFWDFLSVPDTDTQGLTCEASSTNDAFDVKQASKPAAPKSRLAGKRGGTGAGQPPPWTNEDLDRPSPSGTSNIYADDDEPLPHKFRCFFELYKQLPPLVARPLRYITGNGLMDLKNLFAAHNPHKGPAPRALAKPSKRPWLSLSLSGKIIGWARYYLLLTFTPLTRAQSTGDVSSPSPDQSTVTDGADLTLLSWKDLSAYGGCFAMIVVGLLRMVWRESHTDTSPAWLSLLGLLTVATSVGWTAIASTVNTSDSFRWLGLAGWLMCAIAFVSEPLPGMYSPIDRKNVFRSATGVPAFFLGATHTLSADGLNEEKLKFIPVCVTIWWFALYAFAFCCWVPGSATGSTDEVRPDDPMDAEQGYELRLLAGQQVRADSGANGPDLVPTLDQPANNALNAAEQTPPGLVYIYELSAGDVDISDQQASAVDEQSAAAGEQTTIVNDQIASAAPAIDDQVTADNEGGQGAFGIQDTPTDLAQPDESLTTE